MARTVHPWFRQEDGQALVELALAIPVLLVVLLGVFDFGRALNYWNDETHLANLGARYAAVGTLPTADPSCGSSSTLSAYLLCEANIDAPELKNGSASSNGVHTYPTNTSGGMSVCVSVPNNAQGQEVTVMVSADYDWMPLPTLVGRPAFATTPLTATATMRLEAPVPTGWITTTAACA